MLTDPLSLTYNGNAKSLVKIQDKGSRSRYRTIDRELELLFEYTADDRAPGGIARREIKLSRRIPDPTPSNVFDDYRMIRNSFGIVFEFDAFTRAELSVDLPLLRTALLNYVDTTLQGRIITGEH